jgi:predicted ArsR family transcriptional regulator
MAISNKPRRGRVESWQSAVVTARGLADSLAVTPQAALGLLRQLITAGVVREATGRAAWRAFTGQNARNARI